MPAPEPGEQTLAALAARVQAGDRHAENELVERILPGVTAIAVVRLRDRDRARDVAQDTAVALIEALRAGRLRDVEKVAAFAHGILVNVIRASRRARAHALDREPLAGEVSDMPVPDPVQEAEERAILRDALATLEPVDRRILTSTLIDGATPAQIGVRLGLSAELVRTRKSRAVKKVIEFVRRMTRPPAKRYLRQ